MTIKELKEIIKWFDIHIEVLKNERTYLESRIKEINSDIEYSKHTIAFHQEKLIQYKTNNEVIMLCKNIIEGLNIQIEELTTECPYLERRIKRLDYQIVDQKHRTDIYQKELEERLLHSEK